MLIDIQSLKGRTPAIPGRKLPSGNATISEGCCFRGGALIPYRETVQNISVPEGTLTAWVWVNSNGASIDKRAYSADYVTGKILNNEVLYISGGEKPVIKFSSGTEIEWGVAVPEEKPSITRIIDFTTQIEDGEIGATASSSVCYVYTIVDDYGRESRPSPPTSTIDFTQGEYVMVFMAAQPGDLSFKYYRLEGHKIGGLPPGKKRIYRAETGTSGETEFLFIKETSDSEFIDYEEVTVINDDNTSVKREQLTTAQDVIATEEYNPPPDYLSGIRRIPSGSIIGFVKESKEIYVSDEVCNYAFLDKYTVTMPHNIRQIEVFGDDIVVFMDMSVCVLRGYPGTMTMSAIPGVFGSQCKSGRAAVVFEEGIIFPGTDGVYLYSGGACSCITGGFITADQWRSLLISNNRAPMLFSGYFDGMFATASADDETGTINLVDIKEGWLSSITVGGSIRSLYTPKISHIGELPPDCKGDMWALCGSFICKADYGSSKSTAVWQSGDICMFTSVSISGGIILSEIPSVKIKMVIYASLEGREEFVFFNGLVDTNRKFRLPSGKAADSFRVRIETNVDIYAIRLATSVSELWG